MTVDACVHRVFEACRAPLSVGAAALALQLAVGQLAVSLGQDRTTGREAVVPLEASSEAPGGSRVPFSPRVKSGPRSPFEGFDTTRRPSPVSALPNDARPADVPATTSKPTPTTVPSTPAMTTRWARPERASAVVPAVFEDEPSPRLAQQFRPKPAQENLPGEALPFEPIRVREPAPAATPPKPDLEPLVPPANKPLVSDPTKANDAIRNVVNPPTPPAIGPAPAVPKPPPIQLRGRILRRGQPGAVLLEIGGKIIAVREGGRLSLGGMEAVVSEVTSAHVTISLPALNDKLTLW